VGRQRADEPRRAHALEQGGWIYMDLATGRLSVRRGKPLPAVRNGLAGNPGIRAYERPDNTGPVSLTWDDFEVRRASVAAGGG
jgi:hypothetical protein